MRTHCCACEGARSSVPRAAPSAGPRAPLGRKLDANCGVRLLGKCGKRWYFHRMALFEVFIPGKAAGMPNVTLTIEAPNWIGALRSGLKSIGEGQEAIANVMCDIKEDNSIHVTDV